MISVYYGVIKQKKINNKMKCRKKLPYKFKKGSLDNILDRIKVRDEYNQRYPLSFFKEKKKQSSDFLKKTNEKGYLDIVDILIMIDIHEDLFRYSRYTTTPEQEMIIMYNEIKLFNKEYEKVKKHVIKSNLALTP